MNNQIKTVRDKLRIYEKPFINSNFLKEILKKFAPSYTISQLCSRKILVPIKKGEIYFNTECDRKMILLGTTILAQYFQNDPYYAVGWIDLYNQYGYTTQIANKITVYNRFVSWEKTIAQMQFIFKKERESFFYGVEKIDAQWYGTYNQLSRERALLQLLKDTKGQREFSEEIYDLIKNRIINLELLWDLAKKYTSHSTQVLLQDFLKRWKI